MAVLNHGDTESKANLIITGASGMLGDALCRLARRHWTVFGVYRQHRPEIDRIRPVKADLTLPGEISRLLEEIQPQAVIHAAANSQVLACEAHPRQTEGINVHVPAQLADQCAKAGIDFVFTSTDLVFDGLSAPYHEGAKVGPVCVYGRQKVAAETLILDRSPDALVCRLPLMFGLAPHALRHFTVQILKAIRWGHPIDLLVDEFRSPVDNFSAARGILGLLGKTGGIVHLGGRSRVSRYELGLLMANFMNITPDMIRPVTIATLDIGAARAPDCTMESGLAYGLGYTPAPLSEALERVAHQFEKISVG